MLRVNDFGSIGWMEDKRDAQHHSRLARSQVIHITEFPVALANVIIPHLTKQSRHDPIKGEGGRVG